MENELTIYIASALINVTLTRGTLFDPIRNRLEKRFFGKLLKCHFCLGHWIGFLITLLFNIKYTSYPMLVAYPLSMLFNTYIIIFFSSLLIKLIWPQPDPMIELLLSRRKSQ